MQANFVLQKMMHFIYLPQNTYDFKNKEALDQQPSGIVSDIIKRLQGTKYLEMTLPKPAVRQTFRQRFCQPEPVE